jgi:hypothetical protein
MIQTVYNEYTFNPWQFLNPPTGFWDDPENQKRYLIWVGDRLGVERPEDYYRIQNKG